jgi:hypothetical protein
LRGSTWIGESFHAERRSAPERQRREMERPTPKIERTSVIRLSGWIEDVFPLFGPLREREWAPGWEPVAVWPEESVEERMVFVVRSPHSRDRDSTWLVSRYDEADGLIEYTVFAPGSVHWILIQCRAVEDEKATEATITYTYIATSEEGRESNERSMASIYRHELRDWEEAINRYLATGKRIAH